MFTTRRFTCLVWMGSIGAIAACSDANDPAAPPRKMYVLLFPQSTSILQGDSSTLEVNVSSDDTFSGVPQFAITGGPFGVIPRFEVIQTSASIVSARIVINVADDVTPGTYALSLVVSDPGVDPVTTALSLKVIFRQPDCTFTELCAQWANSATASSEYTSDDWSASQATGVPNVNGCTDDPHAWASAGPDDGEWLEVNFEHSVFPTRVEIFENLTTSGIVRVELKDEASTYRTVYTSTPAVHDCPRVLAIPVTNVDVKIKGVRIHFDQVQLGYWNEVDAVKLVGFRQR